MSSDRLVLAGSAGALRKRLIYPYYSIDMSTTVVRKYRGDSLGVSLDMHGRLRVDATVVMDSDRLRERADTLRILRRALELQSKVAEALERQATEAAERRSALAHAPQKKVGVIRAVRATSRAKAKPKALGKRKDTAAKE